MTRDATAIAAAPGGAVDRARTAGTDPLIDVRDLTKVYGEGATAIRALRGVSLLVRHGEFVAIMGPSGSGKSTFMHLLGCLDRPTSGSYRLAGREVSRLSRDELALVRNRQIGFVFQSFNLLANGAPLLMADEPTGNLDSASSAEIMTLFRHLNRDQGITVVVVTHDMDIAAWSERVVAFKDGLIVDDRPAAEAVPPAVREAATREASTSEVRA